MSGRQQIIRLFLQERLTLAAEEIFGVVQKSISEYEEQVVQSKREVEQLKQHILTLTSAGRNSQPVSEELLPLQQLNPGQELMSSEEDDEEDTLVHQSPLVKEEEQVTDSQPVSEEPLPAEPAEPRQELISHQHDEAVQHPSPQVKEEQVDLSIVPHFETGISNCGTNAFVNSEAVGDSLLIPYTNETVIAAHEDDEAVRHPSPQVKEEQVDLSILPHFETSISNRGTNGFVKSEAVGDSLRIPSCSNVTAIAAHDVANGHGESEGSGVPFAQSDAVFCMEQKICRFCRVQFHRDLDLVTHVKDTHTGHKAFKCPECDREFSRRDLWADHYRTHTGAKPHSCPVCGKPFAHRSGFNLHMRTHAGIKPHTCTVCGKLFSQSSNLKVHMRIHTGEKPYFCKKCGKMVAHSNHINRCERTWRRRQNRIAAQPQWLRGKFLSLHNLDYY